MEYATVVVGGTAPNGIYIYQGDTLVAGTNGEVIVPENAPETLSFMYNPALGTTIKVVVTGGSWWKYTIGCPAAVPQTCNTAPEICQIYMELFNRVPDEGGAQFWLNHAQSNNINFKTTSGYNQLKLLIRNRAGTKQDCETAGGVWNGTNSTCSFP